MTVYAITDTKKGRTGIAPTYLQTTQISAYITACNDMQKQKQNPVFPVPNTSASLSYQSVWTTEPTFDGLRLCCWKNSLSHWRRNFFTFCRSSMPQCLFTNTWTRAPMLCQELCASNDMQIKNMTRATTLNRTGDCIQFLVRCDALCGACVAGRNIIVSRLT